MTVESREVRLGIIGIGNMGSNHALRIARGDIEGMKLVAVADAKENRMEWARENLPDDTKIYQNAEDLMKDPDINAVFIATPHYDHPTMVIEAMKHGLHVLCEKPAGVYTKQVRIMNEFADSHPELVFAMMFNQRTNSVYRTVHEMVQSGRYGALKRVNWIITDWYRPQVYYDSGEWRATWAGEGGGVLLNQCPHQLDLLQWICGLPVRVQAFLHEGKWHDIEVEDDVTAYMEFSNGATGVFITSTGDAPGTNRLEIDLEKAKVVCEQDEIYLYELEENERTYCFRAKDAFQKPNGREVDVVLPKENPQHNGVLQAFADCIRKGTPLIAKGQEGINGLSLSNAMHLSGWLHQMVELPVDEERYLEALNQRRMKSRAKTVVKDITFDTGGSY